MRTFAFLKVKKFGFSKFMVCPHRQGRMGLSQCGQVGGGQFFVILCGHLSWTAPNYSIFV